jgi:predicted HTH domain antitoxin
VIKWYELGKISSGMAAKVLDISRVEFIELLGKYKVSIFPYEDKEELLEDLRNAEDGRRKAYSENLIRI